jgi:hypothetical protein
MSISVFILSSAAAGARACAATKVGGKTFRERLVASGAGREVRGVGVLSPIRRHPRQIALALIRLRRPGVVWAPAPLGEDPRGHQRRGTVRVGDREQDREVPTLGVAEDARPLGPRGIQYREHVVDPLLEHGERLLGHAIGKSGSTFVEQNQPRERRQPAEEACKQRLFPSELYIRNPAGDPEQIEIAFAHHLIGDAVRPALGVTRRWSQGPSVPLNALACQNCALEARRPPPPRHCPDPSRARSAARCVAPPPAGRPAPAAAPPSRPPRW